MKSILLLFGNLTSYLAGASFLFPIIASLFVRKKKIVINNQMLIFEAFIYLSFLSQLLSHSVFFDLSKYKDLILCFYLPFHTVILSYFLLKWSIRFKKPLHIAITLTVITIIINFLFNGYNLSPELMYWFDTSILLTLSIYLSYRRDKKIIKLNCENNLIHNGIYTSSLLTILGITLPQMDIFFFGLYIHTIANIVSNIYFARSFKCLYR